MALSIFTKGYLKFLRNLFLQGPLNVTFELVLSFTNYFVSSFSPLYKHFCAMMKL